MTAALPSPAGADDTPAPSGAVDTPAPAGAAGITADDRNVGLFGTLAADWWNPEGSSKLLHRLNPCRMAWVRDQVVRHFGRDRRQRRALDGLSALDVGCGAGLVAEPLARMGARVSAIDAGDAVIAVARDHAAAMGLAIDYHAGDVVAFARRRAARFDVITCLEVLEHVTERAAFAAALARMLKPGGLLIFSTPNRTPISWGVMIAGAEHVLRTIPRGGHDWKQFLTPGETAALLADAGLTVGETVGIGWSPARGFHIGDDRRVNYIGWAVHSAAFPLHQ